MSVIINSQDNKADDWRLRDLVWYGTTVDDAYDFEWVDAIPELEAAGFQVFGEQPKGD